MYPVDVSIIIAVYNVEHYILRAVQSALSQQGVSLEVIIVDDASTDGTWQRIASLKDSRIKCIRLTENKGPGGARNAGIAEASGQWIAILDGDDALEPGRLERCIRLAAARQADIVVDNIRIYREADSALFPMFSASRFAALGGSLGLADFIAGNNSFLTKSYAFGYLKPIFSAAFLQKHNLHYSTALNIGEDYLLFAEALAGGAVCAVEQTIGYIYTVRSNSISYRMSPENAMRFAQEINQFGKRHPLDLESEKAQRELFQGWLGFHRLLLLIDAIKQKNLKTVLRILAKYPGTVRYFPGELQLYLKRQYHLLKCGYKPAYIYFSLSDTGNTIPQETHISMNCVTGMASRALPELQQS